MNKMHRLFFLSIIVFIGCLSSVSGDQNVSSNYDFADIFFIKSMTTHKVNITEYLYALNSEPISNVIHQLQESDDKQLSDCNKVIWLQCGVQVLNCTHVCSYETVGQCIDCLGDTYEMCCPCVEELVHKTLPKCVSV